MPVITIREALRQAMDEEMARDDRVFLMGEEVAQYNGAYKVSQGLLDTYGDRRVIDTPITEEGFAGVGVGAAMVGLRPIIEFMTFNFAFMAIDQLISNAAKLRHMSGGQISLPIVFRGPNGPAEYLSSQHSQACQTFYLHCPGLLVVAPSTAYDFKGMLKTAIRDDNPVIFLEAEMMYAWKGDVPADEFTVPFGQAAVRKTGGDITLISYSKPMHTVMTAAEQLAQQDIEAEVIDVRSLRPFDEETVYASVSKTNRCVVIDESWPVCSFGSHISWLISSNCFDELDAPVELVTSEDVPMPYNHTLELAVQPSVDKIISAAKRALYLE